MGRLLVGVALSPEGDAVNSPRREPRETSKGGSSFRSLWLPRPSGSRMATLYALVALALAAAAQAFAADWPQFRGPNGAGVSDAEGVPAEFGPGKNVLWKTQLPPGPSSPVLAGERLPRRALSGERWGRLDESRSPNR